ncbi:hypothetical protein RMHFA_05564 (plasmid) [Roseomonas mucosa]|nr:hypothetical protein RMHFA_05564 [Roseomonas mucosa]
MKLSKPLFLAALLLSGGVAAQPARPPAPTPLPDATTEAGCVERGVAWFKEIGSWPRLTAPPNKGRSAVDVAVERCRRTVGAFNGMTVTR